MTTIDRTEQRTGLLVDAHVHFYPCFDGAAFLAGARARFRRAASAFGLAPQTAGALLFADPKDDDGIGALRRSPRELARAGWSLSPAEEAGSIVAEHDREGALLLIAGKQITCREGVEVLALGSGVSHPDGAPLDRTLRDVADGGALPVVPWGFGKWWGARGEIVRRVVDSSDAKGLALGDTSLRPSWCPRPALFRRAEERGLRILAGTDPLPFRSMQAAAGRCGFLLEAAVRLDTPMRSIREGLEGGARIVRYGKGDDPVRFAVHQTKMRFRKNRSERKR